MIRRYVFGNPLETDAVLSKPEAVKWNEDEWKLEGNVVSYRLDDDEIVYGLGENVRGINKRGWKYISNCTDDPRHTESTNSLYAAHNFLILDKKDPSCDKTGVFIDTPKKVSFDIGYTESDMLKIEISGSDFELYVIKGKTLDDVVVQLRSLTGRSYIPPRWAFGYGQSRWGYRTQADIKEVEDNYLKNNIPLDSVYLDIDYMQDYKDFTVNEERFPDFEGLVKESAEKGIHLVPIIDAGVKKEDGYDVYEEGKEAGYFCKDENGEDFVVGVWPGRCCLPDMLNDEARRWFGDKYRVLLDKGIDGFWNDMNEPATFYSEKKLNELFGRLDEFKGKDLDIESFFGFVQMSNSLSNNADDQASFYHNYKGQKICHKDVHNLFGYFMTRSASEAFDRFRPDTRVLMFSRASYIGMHRYAGIWQGDNSSWWSHLLMNIKMMPSLNMCGFLYTGADIGGFGMDTTEDLLLRWLEFGVFTPLMRNHSALWTRSQEAYRFGHIDRFRSVIRVRYRLLPYLYSEYMKAALRNEMMFRPLGFIYENDDMARQTEDQLLIGQNIMIAPVHEQNTSGRVVYFPERMKLIRFENDEVTEGGVFEKGFGYVSMPIGSVSVFVRDGYLLPVSKGADNTEKVDYDDLTLYTCGENIHPYEYYSDDGISKDYSLEKHIRILEI